MNLARSLKKAHTNDSISAAAKALAALRKTAPSRPRKWTGYLANGTRAWRGRLVIVPDGRVVQIYCVVRGIAGLLWADPAARLGIGMARCRVELLTAYKNPAAVVLGQKKRGIKERFSEIKAVTSQLNGRRPVRPGQRPRGRPKSG